jgi:hypothetical protein
VELYNLYVSPNIIRVIKPRVMTWTGHVAHMVEMTNKIFWFENLKGRYHSEDLDVDRRIIL